jgi:hypothetical protein
MVATDCRKGEHRPFYTSRDFVEKHKTDFSQGTTLDKIMNKYYNVGSVCKHKRILRRKTE